MSQWRSFSEKAIWLIDWNMYLNFVTFIVQNIIFDGQTIYTPFEHHLYMWDMNIWHFQICKSIKYFDK